MKIFVSHSSRDKSFVREVLSYLPDHVTRWLDEDQLTFGMNIEPSIQSAISKDADYVILFLSEDSLKSTWVKEEFALALEREKELGRVFVLPILMEDIWDKVEPKEFQQRRFLKCFDQSETEVKRLAGQLNDDLFAWLSKRQEEVSHDTTKKLKNVPLTGRWRSTFSWVPMHEDDSGVSSDLVDIEQKGDKITGVSLEGNYQYEFQGRVVGDYVLGEWEGQKLPLFGVFQLKIDIDTGNFASGFWIGNGAQKPYNGEWKWVRVKLTDTP